MYNDRVPAPEANPMLQTVDGSTLSTTFHGLVEDCHQMYGVEVVATNESGTGSPAFSPEFRPSGIVTPGAPPHYVVVLLDGIGESQPGFAMDPYKPLGDNTQSSYYPEHWNASTGREEEANFAGTPKGPWSFFHKWNFGEVNNPAQGISNGQAVDRSDPLYSTSTPRAVRGNAEGIAGGTYTHSFMLDALAGKGAIILPFSYSRTILKDQNQLFTGAHLFRTASGPKFFYPGYSQCDSAQQPYKPECSPDFKRYTTSLDQEVDFIAQIWPSARIVVMGHSQGGLIAFEWFCSAVDPGRCDIGRPCGSGPTASPELPRRIFPRLTHQRCVFADRRLLRRPSNLPGVQPPW